MPLIAQNQDVLPSQLSQLFAEINTNFTTKAVGLFQSAGTLDAPEMYSKPTVIQLSTGINTNFTAKAVGMFIAFATEPNMFHSIS
jgi:hypothetical protein